MGLLLGYVLGRQRERPNAEWARQLDDHVDELRELIDELRSELAVLESAVDASRRIVPLIRPGNADERATVEVFMESLQAAEELLG